MEALARIDGEAFVMLSRRSNQSLEPTAGRCTKKVDG